MELQKTFANKYKSHKKYFAKNSEAKSLKIYYRCLIICTKYIMKGL